MFKFDFDLDDLDDEFAQIPIASAQKSVQETHIQLQPFAEIPISQLLDQLPSLISCSPLLVPLSSGRPLTLVRRDLFDARFQIISESEPHRDPAKASTFEFIEAPSDLVPGVYEGGLKTWECSLDLVNYLDGLEDGFTERDIHGKCVLEIGCGTAVPSLYLLQRLFSSAVFPNGETQLHLQDYNASVLQFISFPNVLLTWYMSASAAPFRESQHKNLQMPQANSVLDSSTPAEIPITPELKSAFLSSLHERKISLRFFSGSWESFDVSTKYDIVLTSETIYRTDSLPSLIKLLRAACGSEEQSIKVPSSNSGPSSYLCLVAAKVIYFGVGGGVSEFLDAVYGSGDRRSVKAEPVWESKAGVGRKIIKMCWNMDHS